MKLRMVRKDLKRQNEVQPDIVLSDIMMPKIVRYRDVQEDKE